MRDPGARLVGRLGCVVNNAAQFAHAVAVYRLRSLVVTLRSGDGDDAEEGGTVFPLAVSLLVVVEVLTGVFSTGLQKGSVVAGGGGGPPPCDPSVTRC